MKNDNNKESEIDILEILQSVYRNKIFLFKIVLFTAIITIIFSLFLPNYYKSSSTFYPHYENINESGSNLKNIAGLAGINIDSETSNNIPPNLYPELINSYGFKNEILKSEIEIFDKKMSYREYLLLQKPLFSPVNVFGEIIKKIKSLIININIDKKNSSLKYISSDDNYLYKLLNDRIQINVNETDGFIMLSVIDKKPDVSASLAFIAKNILQDKIIDFKLKNINDVYVFTNSQLEIAKKNLYKIQDSLANFRDSNITIKSDIFKNNLNRLETEYNILKNIYNELAITKERTAIDVRKNTPIFTIINDVYVPYEKFSPKRLQLVLITVLISFFIGTLWTYVNETNLFNR